MNFAIWPEMPNLHRQSRWRSSRDLIHAYQPQSNAFLGAVPADGVADGGRCQFWVEPGLEKWTRLGPRLIGRTRGKDLGVPSGKRRSRGGRLASGLTGTTNSTFLVRQPLLPTTATYIPA
jgi:hypothetical protein